MRAARPVTDPAEVLLDRLAAAGQASPLGPRSGRQALAGGERQVQRSGGSGLSAGSGSWTCAGSSAGGAPDQGVGPGRRSDRDPGRTHRGARSPPRSPAGAPPRGPPRQTGRPRTGRCGRSRPGRSGPARAPARRARRPPMRRRETRSWCGSGARRRPWPMIEHLFCFVKGPGSRNRLSAAPGRAPGRKRDEPRTSPEPTADHPLNPAEIGPRITKQSDPFRRLKCRPDVLRAWGFATALGGGQPERVVLADPAGARMRAQGPRGPVASVRRGLAHCSDPVEWAGPRSVAALRGPRSVARAPWPRSEARQNRRISAPVVLGRN